MDKKNRIDKPLVMPIAEIVDENPSVKTFWFDHKLDSKPGQFIMLWVPGIDQKPLSISYDTGDRFGVSVFAVGKMTKALFALGVGHRVGITGPYGNPFTVQADTHYITVGGGYGAGPLGSLAEQAVALGSTVDFCVGARSKDLILFEKRIKKLENISVHIATDDGSQGHKGYVTEVLEKLLQDPNTHGGKKIIVATCGPELMEKRVLDLCNEYEVDCEISIERFMKCGYAICGQCCVDPIGIPLCTVGPVLDRDTANQLTEFGKYHRDKSGSKHNY